MSKEKDADGKPMFDVHILIPEGNKKVKESDTMHTIVLDYVDVDYMYPDGRGKSPSELIELFDRINRAEMRILNDRKDVYD